MVVTKSRSSRLVHQQTAHPHGFAPPTPGKMVGWVRWDTQVVISPGGCGRLVNVGAPHSRVRPRKAPPKPRILVPFLPAEVVVPPVWGSWFVNQDTIHPWYGTGPTPLELLRPVRVAGWVCCDEQDTTWQKQELEHDRYEKIPSDRGHL